MDPVSSLVIHDWVPVVAGNVGAAAEDGCSHVRSVDPDRSVLGIVEAVAGVVDQEVDGLADSAHCSVNMDPTALEWTDRVRMGRAPPDRAACPTRPSALEISIEVMLKSWETR